MIVIISSDSKVQTELRSCVEVEVAVLISPSLKVRMVSVDVKQHWTARERSPDLFAHHLNH